MAVPASTIFDFLEQQPSLTIERYEITLLSFSTLRHSLRRIVLELIDSSNDEAIEISGRLRVLISEWLTVPVPFNHSMKNALTVLFGEVGQLQARWGMDMGEWYKEALDASEQIASAVNPIRTKVAEVIRELQSQRTTFRIYCHKRARQHFESLLQNPSNLRLEGNTFLHSVRDYREAEPFNTLIKVGPLRSRGWGSAPDALLTAPRYANLVQLVWSGCNDEADFGYDPVSPQREPRAQVGGLTCYGSTNWTRKIIRSVDPDALLDDYVVDVDELSLFREIDRQREWRKAVLLQIDGVHGILYPPHSRILSFDPDEAAQEPLDYRIPGDTLIEGMFYIMTHLDDIDLLGMQAVHGYYSRIWKEKLQRVMESDHTRLIRRLHNTGLHLEYLDVAVRHWCKPPSTVIHAPQKVQHFEILLRVLDYMTDDPSPQQGPVPFWKLAWNEVRRSRGEAISAGFMEQELVEEKLVGILKNIAPQIRRKALESTGFTIPIPDGAELQGAVIFFKIYIIEEGFRVPETELKVIRELELVDQWRE